MKIKKPKKQNIDNRFIDNKLVPGPESVREWKNRLRGSPEELNKVYKNSMKMSISSVYV
jgi:hypothetical protein